MQRREFVRVIGGSAFTATVAPGYIFAAAGKGPEGVLVEACHFDNPGGWKIDTQFYQQMGGCHLLAHGMGKPVRNATTTATIPEDGTWKVWVRTRDWCPGEWDAPGRFKVRFDGKFLEPEFGAENAKWGWQYGGEVDVKTYRGMRGVRSYPLELVDLTGFGGRCDAIFFTREDNPELPNDDLVELAAWKDRMSGRAKESIEELDYDVVIVGGGLSGCGAALAARSQGLKVAVIQDRPMFGGNASAEVRVHTLGIYGKGEDLIRKIDTVHYPNGSHLAWADQRKREQSLRESGTDCFAHHVAIGLAKDGDRITSVEAREVRSGLIKRFKAPLFIDASGDAWLGYWAGADFREGRESHKEFDEKWDKHGDLWSPETADNKTMGTSVLWNSEQGTRASTFPEVPWAMPVAGKHEAIQGEWYWEYSANDLHQVDDAEEIRDHMFRAIYGSFANAKSHPKNATVQLKWVAYVGGKRVSRRLVGDYVYTMKDATERREFPDTVVEEIRELDTHYQRKETGAPEDFLSKALFRKTGGTYYVPFRCFYSKDISNLMMAGRCFSSSHIGLSGPRVMNTCAQMGIATGYAAALCKKHNTLPREVGKNHIAELRQMIGYSG
jgi:hypothetical protein